MENELPPENLKSLWQSQSVEPVQMSLEELRQKAERFQKRIRFRNLKEDVGSAIAFAWFGYFAWKFPEMRLSFGLIAAGTLYVLYQIHTKGAAKTVPEALALGSCLEFHRQELERQRDLLRGVWRWYLLPIVPGILAVLAVSLLHLPPAKWVRVLPIVLIWAAGFYGIWRLNDRGADKLQRQIDELNSMTREVK